MKFNRRRQPVNPEPLGLGSVVWAELARLG